MKKSIILLILAPFGVCAFAPLHRSPSRNSETTSCLYSSELPTIEQDPFMKQVEYGFSLSNELLENPSTMDLKDSLKAQLSHPLGIRGFMVSYLTANESAADYESIPAVLLQALQEQAERNAEDLIPLACMNVVMPTAMVTMHQDAEQVANSARTAKRGVRVLKALKTFPDVIANAKAILAVATNSLEDNTQLDPKLVQNWTEFFEKWGYEDTQRNDITKVMAELLKHD